MIKEFEEWAGEEGYDLNKVHGRYTHSNTRDVFIGWQKRQPEIDAWMKDNVRLSGIIDNWKERCDMQGTEIKKLKAENERLREAIQNFLDTCEATNPLINGPTFVAIDALHAVMEGK